MRNVDLMNEAASLGGYTIGSTGQDALNKTRAQRRVNLVKADIISRYGGKWDFNYREGWLPLVPNYDTGTVTFTADSRAVVGVGTTWTTAMKGRKILGADGAWYKIASVVDTTNLILTQPYQGTTTAGASYRIWKDEYRLYPEALALGGFVNYHLSTTMTEAWPRNMKDSYPKPTGAVSPSVYTVVGRDPLSATYSTGTVSGTVNTCILTGAGTSWLSNIEPGYEIKIGSVYYHVKRVNSDTEIELYQLLSSTIAALTTYTAVGKNAIIVRFQGPSDQRMVHYWYYAKDYPFVNDSDEDWVAESYAKVIVHGLTAYDYMDKNDPVRADRSVIAYESAIKDMRVAVQSLMTGPRTIGYQIPDDARE